MCVEIALAKKCKTLTKPLKPSVYNLEMPVQSSIGSVVMATQTKFRFMTKTLDLFKTSLISKELFMF